MSDTTLRDLVLKRLDADTKLEDEWSALVLAALEGPDELERLLEAPSVVSTRPPSAPALSHRAPSAVTEGEESAISAPAPASPSSSAATAPASPASPRASSSCSPATPTAGATAARSGANGWRNLHHPKAALATDFALEGERASCTVACEWPEGAELEAAVPWAQVKGKPRTPKDALGWKDALESHRPFLSYNELGSLLDEGRRSSTTPSPRSSA